jgi:hypothetical protein
MDKNQQNNLKAFQILILLMVALGVILRIASTKWDKAGKSLHWYDKQDVQHRRKETPM